MKTAVFESKPRWPGAPPICLTARLPSFPTKAAYQDWHERNGPRCIVKKVWLCDACQHYHATTLAPNPSGDSSGTGRNSR